MHNHRESVEAAEKALSSISGGYVLDVATGNGGFITFLMENLKDYTEITGIDASERTLEAAKNAHDLDNIYFYRMDAARMDFVDHSFDTVCISNSLHHMQELPAALSEMMRVCKPGGRLIISEMYRDGQCQTQLTHVLLHHWWAAVDMAEGIFHQETFTRRQIMEIIAKLNLGSLTSFDLQDLDSDPKNTELISDLDTIIDRYIQRAQPLEGGTRLSQQGEELRQRVHQVGFHGAASLLAIGTKAST